MTGFTDLAAAVGAALAEEGLEQSRRLFAQALGLWRGPAFAGIAGFTTEGASYETCALSATKGAPVTAAAFDEGDAYSDNPVVWAG
ncbi:BTAD domain-containing putative transcriptional regulator [Streptomyces pratensis]